MLSAMQKKFIAAYEGNATEAAKAAGYKERSAYNAGARLMKNDEVLKAIEQKQAAANNEAVASFQERQEFLTQIMRDEDEMTKHRLKAVELLGKMCGDFSERMIIQRTGGDDDDGKLEPPTINVCFTATPKAQEEAISKLSEEELNCLERLCMKMDITKHDIINEMENK